MWELFVVVLLGIVEGVTEFLPISSTGHLLLAQNFLGSSKSDIFTTVIQFGAILAVVFIFWDKLVDLARNIQKPSHLDYVLKLGTSFIITVVGILAVRKLMGGGLTHSTLAISLAMVVGALGIFAAELMLGKREGTANVTWTIAIVVGISQVIAGIFPGTSRSAATIIAAMLVGQSRPAAAEFSFMLGIPTMFAASVYELYKGYKDGSLSHGSSMMELTIGFVVSCAVAFVVVKWLIHYLQSNTFMPFAWYRLVVGDLLLLALWMGWIHG
ncbi:MAG: undecaprenyl-diphosphate phosphatase [Candidatus Methylacidiphilales bacterium]|nr:undecaprenyl-diphosphate phosphatase [Candidatus Methylacidiphilales bacterium]